MNSILRVLVIGAALCCPYLPVVGQNDGDTSSTPSPTDDNNTAFIVSGGELSAPFYSITFESNGSVVDFQNYPLAKGNSYVFKAGNISSSHPFNIGESHNISSQHANGGPLDHNSANNGQNITVTIPADFSGTLAYFCTIHSSMLVQFSFKEPVDTIGASTDTATGDSNGFALDTTSSGPGGDTGTGDSNSFTLDTTSSGPGGDTGIGDSNAFALDTTSSGPGGDTGTGDSNSFTLDTTSSGPGGDTGTGDSNSFSLDTTSTGPGGDTGTGDSNTFALDTTSSGPGGDTGTGDSNSFALDTTSSGPGGDTGTGDSNTFALDTTSSGPGGDTGTGDSNSFALDTTSSGPGGDTGTGDSNTFALDTTSSGPGGDTGTGDSNSFALDTTSSGPGGDTGTGDSNTFALDTTSSGPGGDTGTGDSNTFALDTTSSGPGGDTGTGDSNTFSLNTTSSGPGGDTGTGDSNTFALDTTSSGPGGDTGTGDSNSFSLDTTSSGPGGDTGTGDSNSFALDTTNEIVSIPTANLQLWLDGLDIDGDNSFDNNPSAGTKIASWKDKSNNGYHANQELVDEQPTVSENGGLSFNGIRNHLTLGSNYIFSENNGMTIFASVYTEDDNHSGNTLYSFGSQGSSAVYLSTSTQTTQFITPTHHDGNVSYAYHEESIENLILTSSVKFLDKQIVRVNGYPSDEDNVSLNLINDSTINSYPTREENSGPVTIGGQSKTYRENERFFSGIIREILVYDRALPETEILQVESYLTEKWQSFTDHNGTSENNETQTNQAPQFQTDGNLTVLENENLVYEFNATDADGDTPSYTIENSKDSQFFQINTITGVLNFITARDFENPEDNNTDNIYELTVSVSDGNASATLNVFVTVSDKYEPSKENHTVELNATVGLEMIWVEPGTFMMGQEGVAEPVHEVTLTRGFYLGKYEVTQAQYEAVMTGNDNNVSATPSEESGYANRPVSNVSWNDVQIFLNRLNENEKNANRLPSRWEYKLPTEAEWEYTYRAGSTSTYPWGELVEASNANYGNLVAHTTNVGQYPPNFWGFYDMGGNLWEWLNDFTGAGNTYPDYAVTDPTGLLEDLGSRARRGGSFFQEPNFLKSALRQQHDVSMRNNVIGFRITFKYIPNQDPIDLNFTGSLAFNENLPIGTTLAEFNATDPDGDSLTYQLVDENGSTNNHLFTLEQNGTLETAVLFDFETNASSYLIRVQAKDELNATIEKDFTLTLQDINNSTPLNDSNFMTAINLWFSNEGTAKDNYGHISDWNVSAVTDMSNAFLNRTDFNESIGNWDTSSVTNMYRMFNGASNFNQPVGEWNTTSVTNMASMFQNAQSFNQPIGNWDTKAVTFLTGMFFYAQKFNQPIEEWNVSNVVSMKNMFAYASSFNHPIGSWDTSSNLDLRMMFKGAGAFNQSLNNWNVSKVTDMTSVFESTSLSSENKGQIHATFSLNTNWPYDWSEFLPNQAPQFQTDGNVSVLENETLVYEFNATDADGDALSYSIQSGLDAQLFELNATSGALTFMTARDFENPKDNNTDNIYELTVSVSDGNASATLNVFARVLDQPYEPSKTNHFVQSASGLEMIWVEPGTFTMGSPVSESARSDDETQHEVTISKGFYLSVREVTQGQYQAVMEGNPDGLSATPSQAVGANRPVEMVSWSDVQVFIDRLNEMEETAGRLQEGESYGLPTEAQWEYACRAGTTTRYSWGDDFNTSNANYTGTDIGTTVDVGSYDPNPWGFYDMHGNVWEFCADWYGTYDSDSATDPVGPSDGTVRIKRGGSYVKASGFMRSATRASEGLNKRAGGVGFRLVFYPSMEADSNNDNTSSNDTGSGDSNSFSLDTTDTGSGGDTGSGDSNTFALDTTDSGTGGDTGSGDSNSFSLDTTDTGSGGDTGSGDSNTFALDTTDSGTGGDTGSGDSNSFSLDTTDTGSGGDTGSGDSNTFALDTTDSGTGGDTGSGDSNSFSLDTTDSGLGGDTGSGDSNTFSLDTTDSGTGGDTGSGDSNTFSLDTTDTGSGGDTGSGDSNTFSLDTTDSGTGGDTGSGDSNTFSLDTMDSGSGGDTGSGDSNTFALDTTEESQSESIPVVWDANDQVLVFQVSDEYIWNPELNAVTLWSVDESGGDIQALTMRFENGRNFGQEGFHDLIELPQPYDMPFVIDGNGYIKVTEENGYQYYHVTSIENGIIATLEGSENDIVDNGTNSVDQWFFTSRSSAEEFYFSKLGSKNNTEDEIGLGDSNYFSLDTTNNDADPVMGMGESNIFSLDTTDPNQAPIIHSDDYIGVPENESFVLEVNASDPNEDQIISYSITGGADQELFVINTITGDLKFSSPPNFEEPKDSKLDNVYEVTVSVSDGELEINLNLSIEVLDVQENQAPTDLTLSSSSVLENLPANTKVGRLETIDPNPGDSFSYTILENSYQEKDKNEEEKNENLFRLDGNGTIVTTRTLNFESDPIFTLLEIRTEDQNGAAFTKTFEIELLNVVEDLDQDGVEDAHDEDRDGDGFSNEEEIANGTDPDNLYSLTKNPIVSVFDAMEEENGSLTLNGMVDFDGGGKIFDFGFVLSSRITLNPENSEFYWIRGTGSAAEFTLSVDAHPFSDHYYFRAWARNAAGYGISSVRKIIVEEEPQLWWGNITEHDGDWMSSDWFGTFRYYEKGWMFHSELGWLFTSPDQKDGVWIWTAAHNWLWTKEGTWPYLFKNDTLNWLYYTSRENGNGIFYDFSSSSYDSPNKQETNTSQSEDPEQ